MSSLASFVKAVEAIRGRLAAVADKKNPASLVQQQRELHEVKNAIVELQLKVLPGGDAFSCSPDVHVWLVFGTGGRPARCQHERVRSYPGRHICGVQAV